MTRLLRMAAIAALPVFVTAAHAATPTTIGGSYTATDCPSGDTCPTAPTINYPSSVGTSYSTIGSPGTSTYLASPFSGSLTVGQATTAAPFIVVAPISGLSGTDMTGSVAVAFSFTAPSSTITSVTSSVGNGALVNGAVDVTANYALDYTTQTDCISWNGSCTPPASAGSDTDTPGDTLTITFADNAVLSVTLYNWQDWNMNPEISFNLTSAPHTVSAPEPASLAVFGTSLAALGVLRRRRRAR